MLNPRQLIWPATFLNLCLQVLAFTANESFDERLTINTLQDGKVASKFTFTTLLKGVSPRNPMTLDEEDECGAINLLTSHFKVNLSYNSPTLHFVSS
jgi:phosphatidylinositol glycan class T